VLLGIFVALVTFGTVAVLWLEWVAHRFSPSLDGAELHSVTTDDGWILRVAIRRAAARRFETPVVLAHGLANNLHFFEAPGGLAQFLSKAGFDCYSIEFRGASGPFSLETRDVSFDDHVLLDSPALVRFVLRHSQQTQLHWIGHSLGGLVGAAFAGSSDAGASTLKTLTTIGSPVFLQLPHHTRWLLRFGIQLAVAGSLPAHWLTRAAAPFAFLAVPFKNLSTNLDNISPSLKQYASANAFAPIWRGVLEQLSAWLTSRRFCSRDGTVDYRQELAALKLSMLVIGGTVDGLCPPSAARDHYQQLSSPDKLLLSFGRAHGQQQDYGHGDLCLGQQAPSDVFVPLLAWLEARSFSL
jgi:pimeloyl-ACP methyl ester carboxylesterase